MRHFQESQRGITLTGMISACVVLGALAVGGMKLWPIYNEKMKVDMAMKSVASSPEAAKLSKNEAAKLLSRNFEVQDMLSLSEADVRKLLKVGKVKGMDGKVMLLEYEIRSSLYGQLDGVLRYSNAVELGGARTD